MAIMGVSNMHRVLTVPELLDMIFSILDDADNMSNALVCKQWSEVALDALWREVDDLHRLFSLLAPLNQNKDGEYEFMRLPESKDWNHFEKYSRRVRKLHFHAAGARHVLQHSVFDDIARTRTSLNILPNMQTLLWDAPPALCVMFMHSNVKKLILFLPEPLHDPVTPRPFFEDIISRMPNIAHLDLRTIIPANAIESDMIQLLKGLIKLRKVVFPRFYLTTRMAECLSRHENLGVVEFQYFDEQGYGDSEDTAVFQPNLAEGAFPALWDLSFTVRFEDASRFLDALFAPTNLTMLYINSDKIETPVDFYSILYTISENCQLLQSLALVSDCNPNAQLAAPPSEDAFIIMETLKPLLYCPNLSSLELVHQYPLDLQQEDIEALAASWPSLETLVLNSEPVLLEKAKLTLYALLPFARHCPKLRELGMFIHATSIDILSVSQSGSFSYSRLYPDFRKLKLLSMGTSIISDPGSVALFLSNICPLSVKIESGVTWDDSASAAPEIAGIIKERCEKWDKVEELLPLLTKLRMEERQMTQSLQSEVEDLRFRTGLLMSKGGLGGGDTCVTT